jgi:hypothetical protein
MTPRAAAGLAVSLTEEFSMHTQASLRKSESRITEDHLRIRALLDGLRKIGDPHVLIPLLRELRESLDEHFALEEGEDGLQEIAAEHTPSRVAQVEELLAEHGTLLADIDALIRQCNHCISGPLAEIRSDLQSFFEKIQDHDAAESEILTEVLLKALPGK